MSEITKVALAGDTGILALSILDQLVEAGFEVTLLAHKHSTQTFPPAATVSPVDYTSLDSLTNALEGHDALVCTLELGFLPTHLLLIAAAAKAHIKRFIPSEFGVNTLNENVRAFPTYWNKIDVQDALREEAASGGMTYTLIFTGPTLDIEIYRGWIMNLKEKTINLFDGGDRLFSTTSLPTIGLAVARVLTHLPETQNRAVYVQDTATTLQRLAAIGEMMTGAEGWKKTVVSVDKMLNEAWGELEKPVPGRFAFKMYQAACFGEGFGGHFEVNDNKLLGLGEMSDEVLGIMIDSLANR